MFTLILAIVSIFAALICFLLVSKTLDTKSTDDEWNYHPRYDFYDIRVLDYPNDDLCGRAVIVFKKWGTDENLEVEVNYLNKEHLDRQIKHLKRQYCLLDY